MGQSITPNYKIACLSGIGIVGIIISCLVLFRSQSQSSTRSIFHEIVYDNIVAGALLAESRDLGAGRPASQSLYSSAGYLSTIWQPADTSTAPVLLLCINQDTLGRWSDRLRGNLSLNAISVDYKVVSRGKTWNIISGKTKLGIRTPASDIEFVSKYPAFGGWMLCVMLSMAFCFLTIGCMSMLRINIQRISLCITGPESAISFFGLIDLISLMLIALLAFTWTMTFKDSSIVGGVLFLRNLKNTININDSIGYLAGLMCIGNYIRVSGMLNGIAKEFERNSNYGNLPSETTIPSENSTDEGERVVQILRLFSYLDSCFIFLSASLSLMVLSTSTLLSAVNSLDFVRKMAMQWGYSPVLSDFSYLFGALNSILILIIYLPTRIGLEEFRSRFQNQNVKTPTQQSLLGHTQTTSRQFLTVSIDGLKSTLLSVSPLLTTIANTLFEKIINP